MKEPLESLFLFLTGVVLFVLFFRYLFFRRITILEFERGILYRRGKFDKVLEPGQYWYFPYWSSVQKIDVRKRFSTLKGQEVLTSDSVTIKVTLAAQYDIEDINTAINKIQDYNEAVHLTLQLVLREVVGALTADELLQQRGELAQRLLELSTSKIKELGLRLYQVNIRDIMFPGELKQMFANVVRARKEGLAALERARGETASLRNLANAAKMVENNPALMQLRLLQSLSESSGNTIILGMPPYAVPVPIKRADTPQPEQKKVPPAIEEER